MKNKLKQFYKDLKREEGYDVWISVVVVCFVILIVMNLL